MKNKIKIGNNYDGGIVFHIDENEKHGLVCAEKDLGECFWGLEGDINTSLDIYSGHDNSNLILNKLSSKNYFFGISKKYKTAASLCVNFNSCGFNDWYLPSYSELKLIENNKSLLNKVIRKTFYWSSSGAFNQNNNLFNMAYFSKMGNFDYDTEKLFLGEYMSQISPFDDKCGRWLKLTVLPIRKFYIY